MFSEAGIQLLTDDIFTIHHNKRDENSIIHPWIKSTSTNSEFTSPILKIDDLNFINHKIIYIEGKTYGLITKRIPLNIWICGFESLTE